MYCTNRILGVAEYRYDFPSSLALLPKEKGVRVPIRSPFGRGEGNFSHSYLNSVTLDFLVIQLGH